MELNNRNESNSIKKIEKQSDDIIIIENQP